MAYVRQKGNQVVIVHGERDPATRKVQQRTLFTLYSKAEAQAALGEHGFWFRQILEHDHPTIRFDWKKVEEGIREHADKLPDLHAYKGDRLEGSFRKALVGLTKELLIADPQMLISSARLLQEQRYELEYLRELIDWRLRLCDQEENEWNRDNPFYWRTLMSRREVPPETSERISTLYNKGNLDQAEALVKLLIDCWDNYAGGYNYLGLISRDRGDLDRAQEHFDRAMEVGRALFPKRIKKASYWSDHSTRPYMRAMVFLAETHNRMGEYDKALSLCDRLEQECGDNITAATVRISIYLNNGSWREAAEAASYVQEIFPQKNLPLAFALHELGEQEEALVHFLNGAMRFPRAARILCRLRTKKPTSMSEARDHNFGVAYQHDLEQYLAARSHKGRRFFAGVLKNHEVAAVIEEAETARQRWRDNRSDDRTWFERRNELESMSFARAKAAEIWPETCAK